MTAFLALLTASGLGSAVLGDLLGIVATHQGWLGFGGKAAQALLARKRAAKAAQLRAKADALDYLEQAGANTVDPT